jgi:hypothetical protein
MRKSIIFRRGCKAIVVMQAHIVSFRTSRATAEAVCNTRCNRQRGNTAFHVIEMMDLQ